MNYEIENLLSIFDGMGFVCDERLTQSAVAEIGANILNEGVRNLLKESGASKKIGVAKREMVITQIIAAFTESENGRVTSEQISPLLGIEVKNDDIDLLNKLSAGLKEVAKLSKNAWHSNMAKRFESDSSSSSESASPKTIRFADEDHLNLDYLIEFEHEPLNAIDKLRIHIQSAAFRDDTNATGGITAYLESLDHHEIVDGILALDELKMTLLHYAAPYPKELHTLLNYIPEEQRLAAVSQADANGRTVLHHASSDFESLGTVLRQYQPEAKLAAILLPDSTGMTVLHHAASNQFSIDTVLKLLDKKDRFAAITQFDNNGLSVLHHAATENPPSLKNIYKLLTPSEHQKAIQFLAQNKISSELALQMKEHQAQLVEKYSSESTNSSQTGPKRGSGGSDS